MDKVKETANAIAELLRLLEREIPSLKTDVIRVERNVAEEIMYVGIEFVSESDLGIVAQKG